MCLCMLLLSVWQVQHIYNAHAYENKYQNFGFNKYFCFDCINTQKMAWKWYLSICSSPFDVIGHRNTAMSQQWLSSDTQHFYAWFVLDYFHTEGIQRFSMFAVCTLNNVYSDSLNLLLFQWIWKKKLMITILNYIKRIDFELYWERRLFAGEWVVALRADDYAFDMLYIRTRTLACI